MKTLLIFSLLIASFVAGDFTLELRAGQFEHDIADKTRRAITNLCGSAIVQVGDELVIKSLTRTVKYPAKDRLRHTFPGAPETAAEGPQDAGFLLRMSFGKGPYNQPRVFFRSYPDFPSHEVSTNLAGYTGALVEFPETNMFLVADIWWGKSCDPRVVKKIYDVLLSQIKLALGEPWHGFPGRGLSEPKDGMSISEQYRRRYQVPKN